MFWPCWSSAVVMCDLPNRNRREKKKVFITERSMLVPLASTDSAEWGLTSQSERDAVRFPSDERIQKNSIYKSPHHFFVRHAFIFVLNLAQPPTACCRWTESTTERGSIIPNWNSEGLFFLSFVVAFFSHSPNFLRGFHTLIFFYVSSDSSAIFFNFVCQYFPSSN
jgi:hypothetical protein